MARRRPQVWADRQAIWYAFGSETMSSKALANASPKENSEAIKVSAMGRVEYKVEQVSWEDEHETRLMQLAERLNELAKDGWRVASVDLTPQPSYGAKTLPVLLEREVQG
jgi:hypothetical protein